MSKSKKFDFKAMIAQHIEKGVLAFAIGVTFYFLWSSFKPGIEENQKPTAISSVVQRADTHMKSFDKLPKYQGVEVFKPASFDVKIEKDMSGSREIMPNPIFDPSVFPHIDQRKTPQMLAAKNLQVTTQVVAVALNDKFASQQAVAAASATAAEKAKIAADNLEKKRKLEEARRGKAGKAGGETRQVTPPRSPSTGKAGTGKAPAPAPVVEPDPIHPYEKMYPDVKALVCNMAVITGLIPYREMIEEYRAALIKDKSKDPNHPAAADEPIITNVLVFRAEVTDPNTPPDKLAWQELSPAVINDWYKKYGDKLEDAEELIPSICNAGEAPMLPTAPRDHKIYVTAPLPRLANQVWGRNAVHSRIPLAIDVSKAEFDKVQGDIKPGFNSAPTAVVPLGKTTAVNPMTTRHPATTTMDQQPEEILEYQMFRCIDPFQEYGKKYRYRVQFTFLNPNFEVDKKFVENPDTTGVPELVGPISEPSPISTPPMSQQLIVSKVNPGRKMVEPRVDEFWYWKVGYADKDGIESAAKTGGEIAKDFKDMRLGDLFEHVEKIPSLYNHLTGHQEEVDKYHFSANQSFLVDMHGGEKNSSTQMEEPAEMIYVDADGQLHVSNALRGQVVIDNFKKRYAKGDASATPTRRGGPAIEEGDELLGPRR